jgi:hypothetical protein
MQIVYSVNYSQILKCPMNSQNEYVMASKCLKMMKQFTSFIKYDWRITNACHSYGWHPVVYVTNT